MPSILPETLGRDSCRTFLDMDTRFGLLEGIISGLDFSHFKGRTVLRSADTHGCSILRMHIWRLAVRYVFIHRRMFGQHRSCWFSQTGSMEQGNVVKYL